MTSLCQLLSIYDRDLRTKSETAGASAVVVLGPLHLATFAGGQGFVTYRDLGAADAEAIRSMVRAALVHYRADATVTSVEWKSRSHDRAPGLREALIDNGFVPGEVESIMIGETRFLIQDTPVPDGVCLRKISRDDEIRRMTRMQAEVFGEPDSDLMATDLIERLARKPDMELWIAETGDDVICTGRLEPVQETDFAGIWGGVTRPEWRGRGVYRALTSARAKSALAAGKTLIHSDSTEFSRPILERAGLLKVSTTTPYVWQRG